MNDKNASLVQSVVDILIDEWWSMRDDTFPDNESNSASHQNRHFQALWNFCSPEVQTELTISLAIPMQINGWMDGSWMDGMMDGMGLNSAFCLFRFFSHNAGVINSGRPSQVIDDTERRQIQCHDPGATCHIAGCSYRANSMACHPRATCHIAGCCHFVNSLSWSQSHMPHCMVQSPGEISVMLMRHCRV